MATVTNLKISLQNNTEYTLYASWEFKESSPPSGGGGGGGSAGPVRAGSVVKVKPGSKWYNGVGIDSFVFQKEWIVLEVTGDRAIIHKSTDGAFAIMSPIHVNNLTVVRSRSNQVELISPRDAEPDTLDYYEVKWNYATGNGVWFDGGSSNVKVRNATYNFPSNASKVKVTVKPVSKKKQENGNETPYWTGTSASAEYLVSELPPKKLSAPTVTIDKYSLTAKIENIDDAKAEKVEFEIVKDDSRFDGGISTVKTARASYTCTIAAGGKYRARCRAINYVGGSPVYGPWSPYSSEGEAVPRVPTGVKVSVETKTSVRVSWDRDTISTSYKVEYTTNRSYFGSSSEVKSITVTNNYAIITGLDTGHDWYFRVQGINSKGESGWSDIVYKVIGTKPEPPTTWSLTSTAVIGEPVILYWVHNTEDGSKQNEAQIELTINGVSRIETINTANEEVPEDEVDKIYSYNLDLSTYQDGAEVLWRVRTRGITFEYSEWSVQRTINTYAPPVSTLTLGDNSGILTSFPFTISINAGPSSQKAITYHVSITAENTYRTEDLTGKTITVNAGDEVFSKVFILSTNTLSFDLVPENIILENNQQYKVTTIVSMNSGLTATSSGFFTVVWGDENYQPDASVVIDYKNLCAYISPFCLNNEGNLDTEVVLSVFRREYDGSFTEICSNIENYGSVSVTDPHPALDYARYRIVARNRNTNEIGFTDLPGIPVDEPSIVIQWNEEWSEFDYSEEVAPEIPPWSGSMLRLPYNVDVSESYSPDTSAIEYIGRKYPVSYYGTQRGSTASWSTVIPKEDKKTIYALRRLSAWNGDVYVREPSGNGYTAQITLSMSIKHCDPAVPVSFSVKRVEGGM